MSLKGSISATEFYDTVDAARKGKKKAIDKLSKYVESGLISAEQYEELIGKYEGIDSKGKRGFMSMLIKGLRNVFSILIGLITYVVLESIFTHIFLFLLKIPILSFLMTGYVPADIFLSASVASSATFATAYIVQLISSYKSLNYSVIVVFSTLLIAYIVAFIVRVSTIGFSSVNLISTLIFIVTFIVGGCLGHE